MSLRDLASQVIGEAALPSTTLIALPSLRDITQPATPEARGAMAAAVIATRFRVDTDCRALISTEQARAIAEAAVAAYCTTFRRISNGGGL